MIPTLDPKQFEGHGDGFGVSDQATVAELNKALSAGYASDPAAQSNGGALRVESLDATLKIVSFMEKNIVLYNDIPKTKAYNTVEEYNLLSSYGGRGGFFIQEGGLPRTEDSKYQRKAAFVKFMGTTREITHPMLLVRPAHGNVVALETKNGAKWMLQRMEESLFKGNSSIISESFDGLDRQHALGIADASTAGDGRPAVSEEHVVDLRGDVLSESVFTEVARILLDNYMYPTHCYLPFTAHSDFSKAFFSKGRYGIPVTPADAMVGFVADKVKTPGGVVELRPDVFLRVDETAPAAADNAMAPTAPASAVVTVQAKSTSRGFQAGEYGTYAYEVTAISRSGESAATAGSANAVVTSINSEVKIVVTRGSVSGNDLTQGYRVYRTRLEDGVAGKKYLVAEIASAGATTNVLDGNETLPGAGVAYIGQMDESVLALRELSPMLKFPLATVASSIRWMQLYYNTPILFRPRGWVKIKNIGRLKQPALG
ncbi:hypothetical protein EBR78_09140 [bacterium]|nr:hypothetical protein [bacterium]